MEFDEWEPVYEAICSDFGYDRAGDERGRDLLASLLEKSFDLADLSFVGGATAAIAGRARRSRPSRDLERAREADVVLAASTAVDTLASHGIDVDCMVTDLDKNPDTVERLTAQGVPVAVHGHGDNLAAIRDVVPDCNGAYVLPTTQAAPRGPVQTSAASPTATARRFSPTTSAPRASSSSAGISTIRRSTPRRLTNSSGPNASSTGSSRAATNGSRCSTAAGIRSTPTEFPSARGDSPVTPIARLSRAVVTESDIRRCRFRHRTDTSTPTRASCHSVGTPR